MYTHDDTIAERLELAARIVEVAVDHHHQQVAKDRRALARGCDNCQLAADVAAEEFASLMNSMSALLDDALVGDSWSVRPVPISLEWGYPTVGYDPADPRFDIEADDPRLARHYRDAQ